MFHVAKIMLTFFILGLNMYLQVCRLCAPLYTWRKKRRLRFSLRSLRFSGFSDTLCGSLYDDKLLFVHAVQHPVNVLPALTLAAQFVRVEKFIHGNIKNELVKGVEAGVLAPVLNIHDGARGEVYKLGQVLLRPAFGFSSSSDERKTRGKKRKMSGGFPGINSSKRNDNSQIEETEQKRMFWQSPLS